MAGKDFNTEVGLKFKADTASASASIKSLAADVTRLGKAQTDTQASLGATGKRVTGRIADDAKARADAAGKANKTDQDAAKAGVGLKGLAFSAVAAIGTMTAFAKAAGGAAVAITKGYGLSGASDAFLQNIPIVGDAYKGIKSGVQSVLDPRGQANLEFNTLHADANATKLGYTNPYRIQRANYDLAQRQADNRARTAEYGAADREGIRQQFGRRFEDSIIESENALNRSKREYVIGRGNTSAAKEALDKSAREAEQYKKLRDDAERDVKAGQKNLNKQTTPGEFFSGLNPVGKGLPQAASNAQTLASMEKLREAENDYTAALQRQKAAADNYGKALNDNTALARETKNAETALMAAKRDRAKTLLEESRSGAASFAASSQEDKYLLAASLKQLKDGGADSLAPEQKQLLLGNQLTSEYTKEKLIGNVQNDPLLNSILQTTGRGTLQEQEQNVSKLNAEIDAKVRLDDRQIEDAFSNALRENGLTGDDISKKLADQGVRETDQKLQAGLLGQQSGLR